MHKKVRLILCEPAKPARICENPLDNSYQSAL
nr:MAG TPA: hypothetical protein [Bacteriophage sp.]